MTTDSRRSAIADLDRAVAALGPHLHTAEDKATLTRLQTEVERLTRPIKPVPAAMKDFDSSRLQHLLNLTGPALAGTLLLHLADDLARCKSLVVSGADAPDWDALREGSHVLISLAGSAGALSLQALAETLHTAAQIHDEMTSRTVVPDLVVELDALIVLVKSTPDPADAKGMA